MAIDMTPCASGLHDATESDRVRGLQRAVATDCLACAELLEPLVSGDWGRIPVWQLTRLAGAVMAELDGRKPPGGME